MSLGTWTSRSTKYQRSLRVSLLFTTVLILQLYFWSWYFYACPMCMLALGVYTFAVSVYGFLISRQESRGLIYMVAVFFSIAFLVQLFSISTAIGLRNTIREHHNHQ